MFKRIKARRKYFLMFLFVTIIYFMSAGVSAKSASESTTLHNYDVKLFDNSQNFNMPRNNASYYFYIPDGAVLDNNCYVNIHYSVSGTLIDDHSSMSLSINGTPVATEWIYKIYAKSKGYWKVNIPLNKLRTGKLNEIKIESDHRSILGDCADIDNPSNWVTIYGDSKVHFSDKSVYSLKLANFYSSYFDEFGKNKLLKSEFILPDIKNTGLVSGILKLSSSIGSLYPDRNLMDYKVVQGNSKTKSGADSVVILPYDDLKKEVQSAKLDKDQGYLSISGNSAGNPYYKTIIGGNGGTGLKKAVNFISQSKYLKQINQNTLSVNSSVDKKNKKFATNERGDYVFSDWGYSDVNLQGAFHRTTSFSFVQPRGLESAEGSYIDLKFRHSKILVPERSTLSVYIDGRLAGSTKLSNSNADDGTLKVKIPKSALKSPIIDVSVQVYNYIGKIDCSKDYYDSAWTYIYSNSEIRLIPGKVGIQPSLDNFPYIDKYTDEERNSMLVSFPGNINVDQLDSAVLMAGRLGQSSGKVLDFDVVEGKEAISKKYKDRDMIFIGTFDDINLPDKVKKLLPIVPSGNGKFKIESGIQEVPETLKDKTVIETIRSPWNFYKKVYVVMYENEANLKTFNRLLSDKDNLNGMKNQISIVDNKLGITNISFTDKQDDELPVTFLSVVQSIEGKTGFPWWVLLIAAFLIGMCIVTIMRIRKKSSQFEEAGRIMKESQGFKEKEISKERHEEDEDK